MIVIVGGLIALGVVAAIAVVLLARGENRVVNTVPQQSERVPEISTQEEQGVALIQEQQSEAQMAMATADTGVPTLVEVPQETLGTTPTVETNHREQPEQVDHVSPPVAGEGQLAAELASQYESLARELREVHQKSNEIERRLSLLNEMATRFERVQDGHEENEIERMRRSEREINTETDLRPTPSRILDPYR